MNEYNDNYKNWLQEFFCMSLRRVA